MSGPETFQALSVPTNGEEESLLCPTCGYDLRGSPEERCSECGERFDRATLQVSGFPWAHRRQIGRVKAYMQTVWQVTLGSRKLAAEAYKPQNLKDAKAFRRVTAGILAIPFIAVLIAISLDDMQRCFSFNPLDKPNAWSLDVVLPWSSGMNVPGLMTVLMVLLAAQLTGAQRRLFRLKHLSPKQQERLDAIAYYSTAPWAWLLPAMLLFLPSLFVEPLAYVAIVICPVLFLLAVGGTIWRVSRWAARVRRAGFARGLLAAGQLVGLWLLSGFVLFGFATWAIGFLWLVVDSFL